jgi:hypothetical protein
VWGTGAHRLSLTAFGNRESVHLNPDRAAEAADPSSPESLPPGAVPDDASWGNAALSLRYAGDFRKTRVELGAATTRYRAELPFPLARDTSAQAPPPGNGPPDGMLATGETGRLRLTADAQHTLASGELRVGVSLDRLHTDASAWRLSAPESPVGYRADARGRVLGGYLDGIQRVAPGLDLRYGLRLDHFDPGGTKGALRLALLWSLTEEALLGITVGRYHQLSLATDADLNLQMGDGTTAGTGGVPSSAGDPALLSVARSDHLVVSLDQRLTPAVHLGLEGYFKRFGGLPGVQQQELNASGLDLRLLREGDRLTGWLGYSLSWFWENPDALGRTQEFAGRHLLSVGLRSRPFPDWGVDVEAAFSEGLPLTSIPFSRSVSATAASDSEAIPGTASPPPIATDAFLRLDAEVFAELEPRWRGRSLALRPYLRLLNALNRRDALFYYFEPWRDPGLRPLAELSVVPVLGVEWRF